MINIPADRKFSIYNCNEIVRALWNTLKQWQNQAKRPKMTPRYVLCRGTPGGNSWEFSCRSGEETRRACDWWHRGIGPVVARFGYGRASGEFS